jgi:peptide deformylase
MASLEIARLGNPVLRQLAQPVDLKDLANPDSEIQNFIDNMVETMKVGGGVGLAAPQVSKSIQIVILEYDDNERYPGNPKIPLTVLINPVITKYSEEITEGWESCLSLIDFRGLVPRSTEVVVDAYDRQGNKLHIEASGFLAIVLQHEIDHLLGKVFIDRMTDMTQLSYTKEFDEYWIEEKVADE